MISSRVRMKELGKNAASIHIHCLFSSNAVLLLDGKWLASPQPSAGLIAEANFLMFYLPVLAFISFDKNLLV